ncbi:MAG TPA: aspartate/glutamate racemase family protein [Bacteroidales bacterium]|nr:aspartate/glutamate racemase family protein [Bacteroidales bacterium]
MIKPSILFILILSFAWPLGSLKAQEHYDPGKLYGKNEITIVITDSGLGGLSVMDDIAGKMKDSGCFQKVNLVFVNALFDENTGYNTLQTKKEKTDILNKVLTAIEENYHPDAILIACNTLSVIYPETDFINRSGTPVIGIVDAGVKLISEKMKNDPASSVIIFGTETTIEENSHKNSLLKLNISGDRIITKACPQLQSYIEQDPASEETEMLISVYMNEALEEIGKSDESVYISLNCSHFGYSEKLWAKAIDNSPYKSGGILNPNYIMGNVLMNEKYRNRYAETKISLLVVSKIKLINAISISGFFQDTAPELAVALKNYLLIPELF